MLAGCVRGMLSRSIRAACALNPGGHTPVFTLVTWTGRSNADARSWGSSPYCTAVEDCEQTSEPKKKKHDPRGGATIGSVGRKIPQRQIHVISEAGESLGTMHRADVIKLMDEKGLKLVLLSERQDPPVYRLMSGKQMHEEQLKQREKQKAKSAPVQVKELSFSRGIGAHDLTTKLKQVESWVEKKHHVRITLRAARGGPAVNLESALEEMVQQLGVTVGFISKPKVIRDGHAAMCILRPPSAKELSQEEKKKAAAPQADAVNTTDQTEGKSSP
ncbi:translation initiation factor IF-3, mitochondrial [Nelusetta ayraudi]|uniref:translation initiation factor IF-3, mitochondrial n=1 Tax=Nelusetta ayraudi TaxID=303726 RepID=UPI003F7003F9